MSKRALFKIEADGNDITSLIADRFLELTITDAAGKDSDTFTLSLDNRDDKLRFPATGAKLRVWIGLEGQLVDKGQYSIDEISEGIDDGEIEISGKAADMGGPIKGQKTRTWEAPLTLGHLAGVIADENGLACNIHPSAEGLELGHQNQKAESDMNLLTRICKAHGLLMKVGAGRVLIVPMEAGENAEGQPIPLVVIDDPTESSGRVTLTERGRFGSVSATWFDEVQQKTITEKVEGGDPDGPNTTLKGKYKTQAEAIAAAKAHIEQAARGGVKITLERPLTPEIVSPGEVEIRNHRQSANGVFFVESATHKIGGSFSSTSLSLTTKEHEASKKKAKK